MPPGATFSSSCYRSTRQVHKHGSRNQLAWACLPKVSEAATPGVQARLAGLALLLLGNAPARPGQLPFCITLIIPCPDSSMEVREVWAFNLGSVSSSLGSWLPPIRCNSSSLCHIAAHTVFPDGLMQPLLEDRA